MEAAKEGDISVESCTCGIVIRQLTRRSGTEVTVVHFSTSLIKFVFQTQCQLNDLPDLAVSLTLMNERHSIAPDKRATISASTRALCFHQS